ncbi:peroxisome proliferator-activated receptor gamma coactivator 1-beta [Protopterus annectens]|uniref:peroxisome proliferator-activated receptor gamma coactivator 1-beta n=1 Tax=Protopterus annectens TaxID=7888 RepID=UPI001CFBE934|nr:peroxisome proliferator-activated receptor gamma coactivator 1-beta [Protopterus annectens]
MADCSSLFDEEISSLVFSYLTENNHCGSGQFKDVCIDEQLYSDFLEIDLPPFDSSDLDSVSCLGEPLWYKDHTESDSCQYSTDQSEFLETIDTENEALLAALTETLDDIHADDLGLSAFTTLDDDASPSQTDAFDAPTSILPNIPTYDILTPPTPEADEPSLLEKLLLAPSNNASGNEAHKESKLSRQAVGKGKAPRFPFKVESTQCRKHFSVSAASRQCTELHKPSRQCTELHKPSRQCTELHKHLTSESAESDSSRTNISGESKCASPISQELEEEESSSSEASSGESDVPGSFSERKSVCSTTESNQRYSTQFTSEKEMNAIVEFIKYMHSYCLPSRKQPAEERAEKRNYLQIANMDTSLNKVACSGTLKRTAPVQTGSTACQRADHFTCSSMCKNETQELPLLRMLLERDAPVDVSKPYRIGGTFYTLPVYSKCVSKTEGSVSQRVTREMSRRTVNSSELMSMKQHHECHHASGQERGSLGLQKEVTTTVGSPFTRNICYKKVEKADTISDWDSLETRCSRHLNSQLFNGDFTYAFGEVATEAKVKVEQICQDLEPFTLQERFEEELQLVEVEANSEADRAVEALLLREETRSPIITFDGIGASSDEDQHCKQDLPLKQIERPKFLPLPQSETPFPNKTFEQTLTVELCGTAGLTPPTTPPYKPSEDDHFKPDIKRRSSKDDITGCSPPKKTWVMTVIRNALKKHPEETELYAHLSRATEKTARPEGRYSKRPLSQSLGDHDYCQVLKPETQAQRKILKSWDSKTTADNKHMSWSSVGQNKSSGCQVRDQNSRTSLKVSNAQLKDHEIRASLTKHFGLPNNTLGATEKILCKIPFEQDDDGVFTDSENESSWPLEDTCQEDVSKPCSPRAFPRRNVGCQLKGSAVSGTCFQQHCQQGTFSDSSCSRCKSPVMRRSLRFEKKEKFHIASQNHGLAQKKRDKVYDDRRVVCIRNLSNSMTQAELKARFEVFGEIDECKIIIPKSRDKCGLITFRHIQGAVSALKRGHTLKKRNETPFQMSYGGMRRFHRNTYTDLDSSVDGFAPAATKSKYGIMDFDSLLKEAQRNLHRK